MEPLPDPIPIPEPNIPPHQPVVGQGLALVLLGFIFLFSPQGYIGPTLDISW